ncbi:hypothetical protein M5K25_020032 [Dendrobium thyrsiflorum]|uniref:Uncharacterized protein n=1 Tax=Dendrobium thyrsiflorum TaxID=117978 RepID=A0ABD0U9I5_DENTH
MVAKKVDALEERLEREMSQMKTVSDLHEMVKKILENQIQTTASETKGPMGRTNSEFRRTKKDVEIMEEKGGRYGERRGYGGWHVVYMTDLQFLPVSNYAHDELPTNNNNSNNINIRGSHDFILSGPSSISYYCSALHSIDKLTIPPLDAVANIEIIILGFVWGGFFNAS